MSSKASYRIKFLHRDDSSRIRRQYLNLLLSRIKNINTSFTISQTSLYQKKQWNYLPLTSRTQYSSPTVP